MSTPTERADTGTTGADALPSAVREQLADLAHEQWTGWMRYLFTRSRVNADGSVTIPHDLVLRWQRQMGTPYADLCEAEKSSDRIEADRVLSLLRESAAYALGRGRAATGQDKCDCGHNLAVHPKTDNPATTGECSILECDCDGFVPAGQGEGTAACPSVEFYCESFEDGRKIGGFVVLAASLPDALALAARNIEVRIRPHVTDLRVRTLAEAKASAPAAPSASLIEKLKELEQEIRDKCASRDRISMKVVIVADVLKWADRLSTLLVEAERVEQVPTRREGG